MQPVSIIKALPNRHFAVAAVAAGPACSLLLSLQNILSTSLFALQTVQSVKEGILISLQGYFSGENPQTAFSGDGPAETLARAVLENVSLPIGTTSDYAYPEFSASNISDASVTAPIDGMFGHLDCKSASLNYTMGESQGIMKWTPPDYIGANLGSASVTEIGRMDLITPSCTVSNYSLDSGTSGGFDNTYNDLGNYWETANSYRHYMAKLETEQCDDATGPGGKRIVPTAFQMTRNTPYTDQTYAKSWNATLKLTLDRSVQYTCQPFYRIVSLHATINKTQSSSDVHLERIGSNESTLPDLDPGYMVHHK